MPLRSRRFLRFAAFVLAAAGLYVLWWALMVRPDQQRALAVVEQFLAEWRLPPLTEWDSVDVSRHRFFPGQMSVVLRQKPDREASFSVRLSPLKIEAIFPPLDHMTSTSELSSDEAFARSLLAPYVGQDLAEQAWIGTFYRGPTDLPGNPNLDCLLVHFMFPGAFGHGYATFETGSRKLRHVYATATKSPPPPDPVLALPEPPTLLKPDEALARAKEIIPVTDPSLMSRCLGVRRTFVIPQKGFGVASERLSGKDQRGRAGFVVNFERCIVFVDAETGDSLGGKRIAGR